MSLANLTKLDLTIHGATFIALYWAIKLEYVDLFCQGNINANHSAYGNGASYFKGKIDDTDKLTDLLLKLRISSRYDVAGVYWRRSLIIAIVTSYLLLTIILKRLPKGGELLISILIIYLVTYLSLIYYRHEVSIPASQQVDKITQLLSTKNNVNII